MFLRMERGKAFLNGEEIRVSAVSELKDAFLITELPYNHVRYKRTAEYLIHELYGQVGGIWMNGLAASALCYVAASRFDGWRSSSVNGVMQPVRSSKYGLTSKTGVILTKNT